MSPKCQRTSYLLACGAGIALGGRAAPCRLAARCTSALRTVACSEDGHAHCGNGGAASAAWRECIAQFMVRLALGTTLKSDEASLQNSP